MGTCACTLVSLSRVGADPIQRHQYVNTRGWLHGAKEELNIFST